MSQQLSKCYNNIVKNIHLLSIFIVLLFSLIGLQSLFHPGLFTAHDIWHQVARIYHYYQALNDGQFPPYWIGTLAKGLGYPLFFFSYHLPWIVAFPFLKVGLDIPFTLKLLFFLAYFLSGVSMYFFTNSLFKNKLAALLSSLLYLWAPYHFLTILVIASIGTVFYLYFFTITPVGTFSLL